MVKSVGVMNSEPLLMGIDGGGSKCRAVLYAPDGQALGAGVGGPANPYHGLQQAQNSILASVELALAAGGFSLADMNRLVVGVGLAGVNLPSVFAQMQAWSHPFLHMHLTTDLHIACLGAHGGADGAVIIAGTGSCGYAYRNNQAVIVGGHGFPCGDQGGGAWLGWMGVKSALLAVDHLAPATALTELICAHLKTQASQIVDVMGAATASDFAKLAPLVLDAAERHDEVAQAIVREGAAYLSALADKLWLAESPKLSLLGGLSKRLLPWLPPAVVSRLSAPLATPEQGAFYLAKQALVAR